MLRSRVVYGFTRVCVHAQAMLMTRYSEFLLTLQIIFRLRRKCNFTASVRARTSSLARPRQVLRVTRCLINCTVPNLLARVDRNSLR